MINEAYLNNIALFIRYTFGNEDLSDAQYGGFTPLDDWDDFYLFTVRQGVAPVVSDVIASFVARGREHCFPKLVVRKWAAVVLSTEQKYNNHFETARKLARYFKENDMRMVVLKGFSIASHYPVPSRRTSSDLDCFLFDDYEKGNVLMENKGAKVDRSHYKHSSFKVNGLEVENHHYCTAIRADEILKSMEKCLRNLLDNEKLENIPDTDMLCPGPLFTALFFLEHGRSHFLREGMSMRFIMDWIALNKSFRTIADDGSFDDNLDFLLDVFGLRAFRKTMDSLADCMMGSSTSSVVERFNSMSELDRHVLVDIMNNVKGVEYKKGLKTTFQLVRNAMKSSWKYKAFSQSSMTIWLVRSFFGKILEKEPEL